MLTPLAPQPPYFCFHHQWPQQILLCQQLRLTPPLQGTHSGSFRSVKEEWKCQTHTHTKTTFLPPPLKLLWIKLCFFFYWYSPSYARRRKNFLDIAWHGMTLGKCKISSRKRKEKQEREKGGQMKGKKKGTVERMTGWDCHSLPTTVSDE